MELFRGLEKEDTRVFVYKTLLKKMQDAVNLFDVHRQDTGDGILRAGLHD